ncbi:MAG: CoA-binding protein [bacterium]|jgi:predicted CoA-binding protein
MSNKKTLVLGASSNPDQYSHLAVKKLVHQGHDVVAIGKEPFFIDSVSVVATTEPFEHIHTVTLYLNAGRQENYIDYILSLHPKRVIFNPGAENPAFETRLNSEGIEAIEACTLVMLSAGTY